MNNKTPAKSFLTERNLDKTFWGKRIIRMEARGYANALDKEKVRSWVTCACGKQGAGIPRRDNASPKDNILFIFGINFVSAVHSEKPLSAAVLLTKIESRAREILRDQSRRV